MLYVTLFIMAFRRIALMFGKNYYRDCLMNLLVDLEMCGHPTCFNVNLLAVLLFQGSTTTCHYQWRN